MEVDACLVPQVVPSQLPHSHTQPPLRTFPFNQPLRSLQPLNSFCGNLNFLPELNLFTHRISPRWHHGGALRYCRLSYYIPHRYTTSTIIRTPSACSRSLALARTLDTRYPRSLNAQPVTHVPNYFPPTVNTRTATSTCIAGRVETATSRHSPASQTPLFKEAAPPSESSCSRLADLGRQPTSFLSCGHTTDHFCRGLLIAILLVNGISARRSRPSRDREQLNFTKSS